MKLLFCNNCLNIFSLTTELKYCPCNKSSGRYIDDLNAQYSGDCVLLGINNNSFRKALLLQSFEDKNQLHETCCKGAEFIAFIIPSFAKSVKKI